MQSELRRSGDPSERSERGSIESGISEDYAKSTRFLDILFKFRKKWKLMLDGGVAGAGRPRKGAKSLASMFF